MTVAQLLEPLAVRDAIEEMTDEVLEEAGKVLETMSPDSDWDVWVEANRAFHQTLYSAARSHRLTAIIKSLQDPTVMFVSTALKRHPELRRRADTEHRRLLQAMREGDITAAVELTLTHLTIPLVEADDSVPGPVPDESGGDR